MAEFLNIAPSMGTKSSNDSSRTAVLGFIIGGFLAVILFIFLMSTGYWVYACWTYRQCWTLRRRGTDSGSRRVFPPLRPPWPSREQIIAGVLAGLSSLWGFGTMVEERGRATA
ncbi:hypothetical protein LIA77_03821 [Sarocladium implicatum]|nr:hypothetical protein LIA77_03821 [Sarocladium implicatum]